MSLGAKITDAVNRAFIAASDLVKTGTLSSKTVTAYDFGSRGVTSSSSIATVEVIITDTKKSSVQPYSSTAIFKAGPDMSVYDTLTVNSVVYRITDYTDSGYHIEATLVKET